MCVHECKISIYVSVYFISYVLSKGIAVLLRFQWTDISTIIIYSEGLSIMYTHEHKSAIN